MTSNLAHWQRLQEVGYFEDHPLYSAGWGHNDWRIVQRFKTPIGRRIVVIGSGQGRECKRLLKQVPKSHIWGIDVNPTVLARITGLERVTPVLADQLDALPDVVDFVYSVATMQHITDLWVLNYLEKMRSRMSDSGWMLLQFLHRKQPLPNNGVEPSYSRTLDKVKQLVRTARLHTTTSWTQSIKADALWHWVKVER